ncbi:glutathione S-transferase family protein [Methylomonas sp. AM2-LC]|uniref:glutathione S-transferase family protein n=1 Tax=Methylomonas sp. AM2-LC TaxID=3153301 RepID=UPI003266D1E5
MQQSELPLILYTHPMSRGRVVRWMLEEIGCVYETKLLEYGTSMKAPEFLAINPMGKVPVLKHGEAVVTETIAICTYLAQAFPAALLTPDQDDHHAWADYYRWLFFAAGPLEAAITDKSLGIQIPEERQRSVGYGNFEQVISVIESTLKHKKVIAGNRFSSADLVLSSYLSFYSQFGIIPANSIISDYFTLHKNRPAAIRAEQIDVALLGKP